MRELAWLPGSVAGDLEEAEWRRQYGEQRPAASRILLPVPDPFRASFVIPNTDETIWTAEAAASLVGKRTTCAGKLVLIKATKLTHAGVEVTVEGITPA